MTQRDRLRELLVDYDGQLHALDVKADMLTIEIDGELRLRYEKNKQRLERLGFDVSRYRPTPARRPCEERSHIDVEALVTAATERPLDRLYREFLAGLS